MARTTQEENQPSAQVSTLTPKGKKPSIKTITVRNMVNFLLLASVIFLIIVGVSFRMISYNIIKSKTIAISEVVLAGLTSHMKADIMDKRDYFLEEIKSLYEVREVAVIWPEEHSSLFEIDSLFLKDADSMTRAVFQTGKPVFVMDEFNYEPSIRAIIPYIATEEGSLNCLTCHNVPSGTVLGAVEITLDLSSYRELALAVLTGIVILATIFIVLLCINTFKTVQRHIKEPLEVLASRAKRAYFQREPLSPEEFATFEFEDLANKFNMFNSEILANQDLVKQKNVELLLLNDEIEDTLKKTVFTMGVVEERRSKETANHTRRVREYCNILATRLGLSKHDIEMITAASPLHDIGKLGIPDSILLKPGKLNADEFDVIKNHTGIGHAMLVHSKRDILQAAAIIASQHHEKWDGSGYPQGLAGEEIHIYGRVVALADVFDALTSDRVYRKAMSDEEVLEIIKTGKGKHFDPALVELFFAELDTFMTIKNKYQDGPMSEDRNHPEAV
jgi:response regulator RpfG family c-di-GMP phosphodiesterase